jgi:hypothetical protein
MNEEPGTRKRGKTGTAARKQAAADERAIEHSTATATMTGPLVPRSSGSLPVPRAVSVRLK